MTRATLVFRKSSSRDPAQSIEGQRRRCGEFVALRDWEVVSEHAEPGTSGGLELASRRGLTAAVEDVELGSADVLLVAYRDRLDRELSVRREVCRRVEAAGGEVWAADSGRVTFGTADEGFASTVFGASDEHYRRKVGEKTADAKRRAIERGVPCGRTPFGYDREPHEPATVNQEEAELVVRALRMEADGASVEERRAMLREAGHDLDFTRVQKLGHSAFYRGQVSFGPWVNPSAHDPISPDVERLQRQAAAAHKKRGSRPRSRRLLARLGVLRCSGCGSRMVVATGGRAGDRVVVYRCPPNGHCGRRVAISADAAERAVEHAVRVALRDVQGRSGDGLTPLQDALDRAQARLDRATRVAMLGDVDEAQASAALAEARATRDAARDALGEVSAIRGAVVHGGLVWEELGLGARRELVQLLVATATVAPANGGRPEERVAVELAPGADPTRLLDRIAADFAEATADLAELGAPEL